MVIARRAAEFLVQTNVERAPIAQPGDRITQRQLGLMGERFVQPRLEGDDALADLQPRLQLVQVEGFDHVIIRARLQPAQHMLARHGRRCR